MLDIIAVVGTLVPIPCIIVMTVLSLTIGTVLNTFAIPIEYHFFSNVAMVGVPSISLLLGIYVYCLSVLASPIIRAIHRDTGIEDIDPVTIVRDATTRTVVATYYVRCSHQEESTSKRVTTFMATHTHEVQHTDETSMDLGVKGDMMIQMVLKPNVIVDEDSKRFLDGIKQDLYQFYKGRDKICNIKYSLEIPGIPSMHMLVPNNKHVMLNHRLMMLIVATVFLTPIYVLVCRLNTRFISHLITKRLMPEVVKGYDYGASAPCMSNENGL